MTSIERLKEILRSRYGKGLELSYVNDLSEVESAGASFSLQNGALEIPIIAGDQFLAMAKIPEAESMPESSQQAVVDIVRLILEPALYNWYLENQQKIEEQSQHHDFGGLTRISRLREVTNESQDEKKSEETRAVLITSVNPHRTARVAQDVHEQLKRWAFLRWSEVRSQIFSIRDLQDLGALSIFVEDILELSQDEKFLLNEWVTLEHDDKEPVLILGSTMEWSEIDKQDLLPYELLKKAGYHQVLADRLPLDRKNHLEAIKLLLDKTGSSHSS